MTAGDSQDAPVENDAAGTTEQARIEAVSAFQRKLLARIAEGGPESSDRRVTAVVTSCGRHDLLIRTLRSFFETNTYPLEKVIVVEDGSEELDPAYKALFEAQPMEWMSTGERVGQIRAIDAAYARVSTPFIFHLEDDWLFYRSGYVERSMPILLGEPGCLQVWLRGFSWGHSHPMGEETFASNGVGWRKVLDFREIWHGFSFNPGLRRLEDYRLIGSSYAANIDRSNPLGPEAQLSILYKQIGYFAATLAENESQGEDLGGYVRHKGKGRQVSTPKRLALYRL